MVPFAYSSDSMTTDDIMVRGYKQENAIYQLQFILDPRKLREPM
jgi:hypothetical protein